MRRARMSFLACTIIISTSLPVWLGEYSVECGLPFVGGLSDLIALENPFSKRMGRGFGYHESVAGDIDRHTIDLIINDRPVRIQHDQGRWILNTYACELLQIDKHIYLEGVEKNKDGLPLADCSV